MLYYCAYPYLDINTPIDLWREEMTRCGFSVNAPDSHYLDRQCTGYSTRYDDRGNKIAGDLSFAFPGISLISGNADNGFITSFVEDRDSVTIRNGQYAAKFECSGPEKPAYIRVALEDKPCYIYTPSHIVEKLNSIDLGFEHDGLEIFCSVIDVVTSNPYKTVIRAIGSNDFLTVSTSAARRLFTPLDKLDYIDLFNEDDENWLFNSRCPHPSKCPDANRLHFFRAFSAQLSFRAKIRYLLEPCYITHGHDGKFADIAIFNGKKYSRDKFKGMLCHIEGRANFIPYTVQTTISKQTLYETEVMETEVVDIPGPPKELPGVKLKKEDNGFFEDAVIEVDVK